MAFKGSVSYFSGAKIIFFDRSLAGQILNEVTTFAAKTA
jgi:hypothetical protein